MSLKVYDFHTDIANVLVTPQIRCRFMKMEVGQAAGGHTHDLGHEIFLVLQGQAEFEVDGERATLGPGEFCIALVDQYHSVRNVGDEEVIMFLSVTPHIQPTHTFWNEDGTKKPPRFMPAGSYDEPADRDTPTAELAERHAAAAAALAESADAAGAVQRAGSRPLPAGAGGRGRTGRRGGARTDVERGVRRAEPCHGARRHVEHVRRPHRRSAGRRTGRMSRLKVGVVGCGAIAQIHHLPNLTALHEHFEVSVVCDVSPSAAAAAARRFHVPEHVTDYRRVLDSDVDAVVLCHTDPKTEAAVATLQAGKHLFIEKPVCFSLQEMDAMIAAHGSGLVAQAAYVKVYEPGFELAQQAVGRMDDVRFVQINHLHPDNRLHLQQFDLQRFDDHPAGSLEAATEARRAAYRQAIGEVDAELERAFGLLTGSMIHDLYTLRVMVGRPSST